MAPESPVDELSEKHKLILIKREVAVGSKFPLGVSDGPTRAEAALIALALVSKCNNVNALRWASLVLEQEHAYQAALEQGKLWSAPNQGHWLKPSGEIHSTVQTGICREGPELSCYATALVSFGEVPDPPKRGTLSSWFSKLLAGGENSLKVAGPKRPVQRNPFIFMAAARLLRDSAKELNEAVNLHVLRLTPAVKEAAAATAYVSREEVKKEVQKLQQEADRAKRQRVETAAALKKESAALKKAEEDVSRMRAERDAIRDAAGRQVDDMEAARKRDLEDLEQRHQVDLAFLSEAILKANLELERLRDRCARGRTAELEQQITEQSAKILELSGRRDNNMGATRLLNLERRRVEELKRTNEELRATITANWGKDTFELADAAREIPRLEAENNSLKAAITDAEDEIRALRRVVFPPPPMEGCILDASPLYGHEADWYRKCVPHPHT